MFFSRKVRVTFIDDAAGAVVGTSKMAPAQLPESFLAETTMQIGDEEWAVLQAEPPLREEFEKTGKLVLRLRREKIEYIDPKELLFSLPTLNDGLPAPGARADGREIVLHEDDWRQVELLHASQRESIDEELHDIRRLYNEHRRGIGFDELHVRRRIRSPLAGAEISLQRLGVFGTPRPLRFSGYGQRVADGFAYVLDGDWLLYGQTNGRHFESLAVQPGGVSLPDPARELLAALACENVLLLVDWCLLRVGQPGDADFAATLERM